MAYRTLGRTGFEVSDIAAGTGLSKDRRKTAIIDRTRKCLERLQTDYIDCVMIHSAPDTETLKTPEFHEAMAELKSEDCEKYAMTQYASLALPKADHCRNCEGTCEAACPDGVPIQTMLALAQGARQDCEMTINHQATRR